MALEVVPALTPMSDTEVIVTVNVVFRKGKTEKL